MKPAKNASNHPRTATSTTAADFLPRTFARPLALAGLGCALAAWLAGPTGRMLVALPLLLFGPGFLIERALRLDTPALPGLRPSLWLGLSLSVIALLYEWAGVIGLALTTPRLGALALAVGLGVLWRVWQGRDTSRQTKGALLAPTPYLPIPIPQMAWALALLAVLALTLWTRAEQVRDLALPSWVDSVHHALLIRVAAERGAAPLDLRPYLPISEIPYHWGYHVFVAALMQLAGASLPMAMLVSGQVLNALHVVAAAGLACYLWRRPVAGLVAAAVVGVISIMPAYYVSWGRYTQLTGLLLLSSIIICWLELLRAPSLRPAALLALLLAGLSQIHFVVLVFALGFMLVSGASWLLGRESFGEARLAETRDQGRTTKEAGTGFSSFALGRSPTHTSTDLRHTLLAAGASAAGALALAAPWLWLLLRRKLLPDPTNPTLPLIGGGSFNGLDPSLLWAGHNRALIALALAAALLGLQRRRRAAADLLGWVGLLTVLTNPQLALYVLPAAGFVLALNGLAQRRLPVALAGLALLPLNPLLVKLPYLSLLTTEALVISLFVPLGALLGGGAALLWERLAAMPRAGLAAQGALLLALAGLAGWSAWVMREVVRPSTVLATPADVAAIEWAAEHTPPDARFLINTAAWLETGRGTDGGFWLLPLAGRWTSAPPVLFDYGAPEYAAAIRARNRLVMSFEPGREQQIYDLIAREGITYVYLGAKPGRLTAAAFPRSAGFEPVYQQDGVTILAVRRP